ncbi:MAG TPA: helix-turn-helix transcriptional regulator [Blastocatellia bacterium]|nr:helix-turn-helix transcriptional regulator [Blastocatellia bacterium]
MGKGYLSYSVAVILQALDNGYKYGFDIMDITGLPSGTVYPALRRLEEGDLVVSKWEKQTVAQREQRPPRKYYELTREGREALAEAVKRYRLLEQTPLMTREPRPSGQRG